MEDLGFLSTAVSQDESKPPLSHENMLINELIREYLEYNHYKHTLSVLIPETGQPIDRMDRAYMAQELNMREDRTSRLVSSKIIRTPLTIFLPCSSVFSLSPFIISPEPDKDLHFLSCPQQTGYRKALTGRLRQIPLIYGVLARLQQQPAAHDDAAVGPALVPASNPPVRAGCPAACKGLT